MIASSNGASPDIYVGCLAYDSTDYRKYCIIYYCVKQTNLLKNKFEASWNGNWTTKIIKVTSLSLVL